MSIVDEIKAAPPAVGYLSIIGGIVAVQFGLKLLLNIYKWFLRPGKDLKKFGKWVVITGATDGIGKAYAFAMAKRGLNVLLISRTESKLQDVQKEILAKYSSGVEIKYIVCDYGNFTEDLKKKIKAQIDTLDVGILINNVGLGYRYPRYFHELPDDEVSNLLSLNIDSTVYMTRMVLPGMIQRKRGSIINLSSGSALMTIPLLSEYGGAKSFVEKFSRAINAEYSVSHNITCQCQVPFYVATKLAKMRKSLTVPTPEEYVNVAIKWIGHAGDALAQPFWLHAIIGYMMIDVLPEFIANKVVLSMHLTTRKLGLKKDAKLAAEKDEKSK